MSLEGHQSFAGHPPTPTRTPPIAEPDEDAFQTPTNLESSFYDPRVNWDTADPSANPNLLNTPRPFSLSTPAAGRSGNSFETPRKSKEFSAHAAQLLTTPNFALLSPQTGSSEASAEQEQSGSMESLIQTPPPTNTGHGKRREKQNGTNRSHRRSESSNRALLPKPPESGASTAPTEAPVQFTPIAFNTPDLFNTSLDMPATAPIYPQKQLFWDDNGMELDFSTDNPFATPKPTTQGLEPFVSSHQAPPMLHQGPASFLDFDQMLANPDYNTNPVSTNVDLQMATSFGHGVDPNLLFSSTNAAGVSLQGPIGDDALQPYAFQVQESRRETAYAGINKARRRRKPSVDSPAVAAALETLRDGPSRPGVRRSMTDSHVPRSGRSSSSSSRAGTSHGGRSSPVKQIRAETKRRHRTSVGLVIGSDGRARLEAVVHQAKSASSRDDRDRDMDVDSTTYSSDSDSSETDEEESSPNALVTSFSSDVGASTGLPMMGRFGSGSHSKQSSFSSLYSSNSEQSKTRKSSSKRASRQILDPVKEGGSFEDDRSRETDSAQAALMHSMKSSQRGRYSPQKQSSGLEPFVSSPILQPGFGTANSSTRGRKTSFR